MILNYLFSNKIKIRLTIFNCVKVHKRSMMSVSRALKHGLGLNNVPPSTRHLLIRRPTVLTEHQRNYPGDFHGLIWKIPSKNAPLNHERDDHGLTLHQATHINIQHTDTDPNKGGQYVAVLVTPRKLGDDVKHLAPIDSKLQAYLDQHETQLKQILENASKHRSSRLVKYIGNKDGE